MRPERPAGLPIQTRIALIALTRSLAEVRPALRAGLRVPAPELDDAATALLRSVVEAADLPELAGPGEPPAPLRAALARVAQAASAPELGLAQRPEYAAAVAGTVAAVVSESIAGWAEPRELRAADGTHLPTYRRGDRSAPAVVLASACGMPAELCSDWMAALSRQHHVITWETRGLFGDRGGPADFDARAVDPQAQADDLIAVLDHHGVADAHVVGLCGGAVVALLAAARAPHRVRSLSLWHGDYELGPSCEKTDHQHNLKALLEMAQAGRADASAINAALSSVTLSGVDDRHAAIVGYPYLDDELFYRYCALTGSIMAADVAAVLPHVTQPALVITSGDDRTAHPAGSHAVAAALSGGRLHVEPHGDHLSVFSAPARLQQVLRAFLVETERECAA